MFHNLAEDITFILITHKIISIEDRDVYMYGLEVILLNACLLFVYAIISLVSREMSNFLAYLVFFIPLRIFAGGYHAKTSERCFVLSTIMYGISIVAVKVIPFLYKTSTAKMLGLISIFGIVIMAPMINENNPLNKKQVKRNRIISYAIIVFDLVVYILCYNFDWHIATNELVFIILVALLLFIGKVSPCFEDNNMS